MRCWEWREESCFRWHVSWQLCFETERVGIERFLLYLFLFLGELAAFDLEWMEASRNSASKLRVTLPPPRLMPMLQRPQATCTISHPSEKHRVTRKFTFFPFFCVSFGHLLQLITCLHVSVLIHSSCMNNEKCNLSWKLATEGAWSPPSFLSYCRHGKCWYELAVAITSSSILLVARTRQLEATLLCKEQSHLAKERILGPQHVLLSDYH